MRRSLVLGALFALAWWCASARASVVHRYSFATDASDSVGTLHGTPGDEVTFDGLGRVAFSGTTAIGSQISFGSNDIAAISAASGAVSIEFWGRFNWNGDDANVFNVGGGTTNDGLTQWAGNGQHILARTPVASGGIDNWGLTGLAPLSGWGGGPDVHIVDIFDTVNNTVTLYVNGALYATGSMGGASLTSIGSSVFNLGGPTMTGGGGILKGSLDEFRIWDTALDALTIAAAHAAGPNTVPVINYATSAASSDWNLADTWSPAGIPDDTTAVTIDGHAIQLGSENGASGSAMGLTIRNTGSLNMTGATLSVSSVLDTTDGVLVMDGTSALSLVSTDTAAGLKNVSATSGSTINVSDTLTVNAAKTFTGANVAAKNLTADGATFDTAELSSFQLTGGAILAKNNGTFTHTLGSTVNATGISFDTGGTINVIGPADGPRPLLAVSGEANVNTWGDLWTRQAVLTIDNADFTAGNIRLGHDEGEARAKMVVKGTGTVVTGDLQQDFNGAIGGLVVQDSGQVTINGYWEVNPAHDGNTQNEFRNNAVIVAAGDARWGSNNGVDWFGQTLGSTQFAVTQVSESASVTVNGTLTMLDSIKGGANGGGYSQVDQTGGTVEVKGADGLIMARDYVSGVMQSSYNLAGGELKVPKISRGSGTAGGVAQINFHGGTLTYNGMADQADFLNLGTNGSAYVYEGATVNAEGLNVTVSQPLLSPNDGNGLSAIDVPAPIGSGYPVAPAVVIKGGGGVGATAVAALDPLTGAVTGITVTNPGTGYTSNPTVYLSIRSQFEATQVDDANVHLAPNAFSGGLTKTGSGKLTLNAVNTYTGDTAINAGTLAVTIDGAIPSGAGKGNVVLNGGESAAGTLDLSGLDVNINGLAGSTGAVLGQVLNTGAGLNEILVGNGDATTSFAGIIVDNDGIATGILGLKKVGGGTLTLSGPNGYTGGTTVAGGTLTIATADSLPEGGGLTIAAGGSVVFSSGMSEAGAAAGGGAAIANAVPEPGTLALLSAAAMCVLWISRRRMGR